MFPLSILNQHLSLQEHQKSAHVIVCETCSKTFTSQGDLDKHVKNHHNRPCITCQAVFKTISELKEHMKTSHGPHCTICDKEFEKSEDLQKHMVEAHAVKSPSKNLQVEQRICSICKERFESPDALTTHSQSCSGGQCQECNLNFQLKSELEAHIKAHHDVTF